MLLFHAATKKRLYTFTLQKSARGLVFEVIMESETLSGFVADSVKQQQEPDFPLFPQEEWYEQILRYGLYLGAAFQIICILAIIFDVSPQSSSKKTGQENSENFRGQSSEESTSDDDSEAEVSTSTTSNNQSRNKSYRKLEKKKRK